MKEIKVTNKNNIFQRIEVLKRNRNKRYKYNEFFVEGVRSLNQAVENHWKIKSFIYNKKSLSDWAKRMIETIKTEVNYCLTVELMSELSEKSDKSELMAIVEMREDTLDNTYISDNPFIVLFDRPSNKGNLGTIIRSCDAFGVDMLIITGHAVDLYDTEVVVASMGSFFNVPVIRAKDNDSLYKFFQNLKENYDGFSILGTTAHDEHPIDSVDLTGPMVLMIGNETKGLSKNFKDYCDMLCTIPMSPQSCASSFNVGCAASIMMYEIVRQRGLHS